MTREEIRLELLRLCMPAVANPDVHMAIEKAKAAEAYVLGEGQAARPPLHAHATPPHIQARTHQQSSGPARK